MRSGRKDAHLPRYLDTYLISRSGVNGHASDSLLVATAARATKRETVVRSSDHSRLDKLTLIKQLKKYTRTRDRSSRVSANAFSERARRSKTYEPGEARDTYVRCERKRGCKHLRSSVGALVGLSTRYAGFWGCIRRACSLSYKKRVLLSLVLK